jgi:hypothetical protein
MVKVISIILLIYGAAGVVGTIIVYVSLQKPIKRLRELLPLLSKNLLKASDYTKTAGEWVDKGSPILQKAAEILAFIVTFIREIAHLFGKAAGFIKGVEPILDSIKVPVLTFQTKTLNLSFGATVVTGVHLKKFDVNIPGDGSFDLYGPPLDVDTSTVGLNLGQVPVITGVNQAYVNPLQPAGDAFRFVGEQLEAVQQQVDGAGDKVDQARDRTLEAKENVENTAGNLKNLAHELQEAGQNVLELSKGKVLSLVPALVLGYFGLIHLAFALTGLALLFM